jgi:hypothetical protein
MSFEIKYQTKAALFHVKIERDVNAQEAHELAQLALNITAIADGEKVYGPPLPPGYHPPMRRPDESEGLITHLRNDTGSGINGQNKLGEKPVSEINMMGYQEPKEGVRIKMLAFPEARTKAIWAFRNQTGISLIGSRDIVYGNFPCPILKPEIAEKIMADFRSLEVFAKIVPADNRGQAA